jgi:hypothetical protein
VLELAKNKYSVEVANGFSLVTHVQTPTPINTVMKQFRTTVRASGAVVATMVYEENTTFAIKILHAVFGAADVISIPTVMQYAH